MQNSKFEKKKINELGPKSLEQARSSDLGKRATQVTQHKRVNGIAFNITTYLKIISLS